MSRMNIRISGLGGQGAVTAAHLLAMAANKDGKFSISNPFFGAEKRMAPAESYARIGSERIYDRGELVYPDVIMIFHPQVITMQKSYTAPFYSGIKENGLVIINTSDDLLSDEDHQRLEEINVSVLNHDATKLALEIGKTELSTNMAMIGACAGVTKVVSLKALDGALQDRFGKRYVASGGTATLDEAIKKKYGDRMQLSAELHGMWNLPESLVICRALDEIGMRWIEDPVFLTNAEGIKGLKGEVRSRIAMGETRGGADDFKIFLDTGALSLLILDIGWCGGLTEARRCAALASSYQTPVAAHDCNGPVVLTASVHFCQATKNAYVQEIVRAFYYGWYDEIVTQLPPINNGWIESPQGPGLGLELLPDFKKRKTTSIRSSSV